ncbi:DUF262 domain-containing protein [Streptomyces sp. NBC_00264]|uniref:DUF262 domain-containing protein n=1 Tax=unclassified Streptomyces TaxID=2593676 RepID=UPI00225AAF87|nr:MULTISPECIES: DUF262 domain-containing protein [unclassified Streptomyces]MCX5159993.1 DUF262 domain-containing protein [Streptomyces sp. NBC_00305]MCX5218516.1 DUF262 domain-containing protein [Streptomyces sp. NBC_00264]
MSDVNDSDARIYFAMDSEDEFSEDYEAPGALTFKQVQGTVIYTLDWTVGTVVEQIDSDPDDPDSTGSLLTSPPFQRRTAWNEEKQSLFIESLMLGLPVPPLVLAESNVNPNQFYVLDGKQRLTALREFLKSETPLRLKGLELLDNELRGRTFEQIRMQQETRSFARSLLAQPIRTIVVRNWRTPALLHLIFSRLNRQSVPLASHELRQALYPGRMTNFVNRRSGASTELLRARRLPAEDPRLRDAETLLRFIAFKTNAGKYRGDLRDFLDRVLKGGNDHFADIEGELSDLVTDMEAAISATFSIFGKVAFLRYAGDRSKYMPRFNVGVFEIMTWYFTEPAVRSRALEDPRKVVETFERLATENTQFAGYLTSTTKTRAAAVGRLEVWGAALGEALGMPLPYEDFERNFLPIAPRV